MNPVYVAYAARALPLGRQLLDLLGLQQPHRRAPAGRERFLKDLRLGMDHARQKEPGLRQLLRRDAPGNHQDIDLRYAVGDPRKGLAHGAGNELDPRSRGLQQAMGFTERDAGAVGRSAGFEKIDPRVVDVANLVEFLEHLDDMDGPLAGTEAKFDDFPGFQPTNLAVNEAIGSRLGKMEKVEQTKTTQTSHIGLPAVMTRANV